MDPKKNLRTDGNKYIPFEERTGQESFVYFTRDLSAEGLDKICNKVKENIDGKIAIKLHTGEKNGPNIIPRPWIEYLIKKEFPNATIIETNSYYKGGRYTTEDHREVLKVNGWTFAPVDIMDEHGTVDLPVKGGKWFDHMTFGKSITNYDSLLVLTHFKGHVCGGFGGSNKNIGIGCADGRIGKAMIHTTPGQSNQWDIKEEEFMERMSESTKAVVDHFEQKITFINVMRNMSVDCDCAGTSASPVVTPDIGILASRDIVALDQACVDLIFEMGEKYNKAFVERMTSRHAFRQLSYMQELGMGNVKYKLLDIDGEEKEILRSDAVKHIKPFKNI